MNKKKILVIGLLVLGFAMLAQTIFGWTLSADDMQLVNTQVRISYGFDAHPSFHSNSSRFFHFVTRAGIRYVASDGTNREHHQFSLTRPRMATRGNIVAVGEAERGRIIFVYDSSEHLYTVAPDNPVLGFSVNGSAYLSVITQRDDGYGIHVFNRRNIVEPLYSKRVSQGVSPMLMPVAAEVSDNGRFIAVAYLDLNVQLTTIVDFMFINQEDAPWGTDGLFAQKSFPDEILLGMRFMANNTVLIITDRRINLYNTTGDEVQLAWSVELHNNLDQLAFYGDTRFAFVSGAPIGVGNSEADPVGTVNMFNLSGQTGSFELGRAATHLSMGHNAVIVGSNRYFHAVNARGESLWHHNAVHDVRDMIFLDNTDTVLIAGPNRAYVWRRQRDRVEPVEYDVTDVE